MKRSTESGIFRTNYVNIQVFEENDVIYYKSKTMTGKGNLFLMHILAQA